MGRSKKSKDVERKVQEETRKYHQGLAVVKRAHEVAQREAIAEQQTKIAHHVAEAASRILALVPGLAQQVKDAEGEADGSATAATGATATGATATDETAAGETAAGGSATGACQDAAAKTDGGAAPYAIDPSTIDQALPTMDSIIRYFTDLDSGLLAEVVQASSALKAADLHGGHAEWSTPTEPFDSFRSAVAPLPAVYTPPMDTKPRRRTNKKACDGEEMSEALQAALAHSEELQNDAEAMMSLLEPRLEPHGTSVDAADTIAGEELLTLLS